MKLLRHSTLELREGSLEKVYEIDLCEVAPDRYVVNFRFGRRGARLHEGSKTPLPVSLPAAERIYDKLVADQTAKGYRRSTGGAAPAPAPPAPKAPAPPAPTPKAPAPKAPSAPPPQASGIQLEGVEDPRHRRLVELLASRGMGGWTRDLDRLIWRAGELRVRAAAPLIAAISDRVDDRRAWNVARALLRCGDPATAPALLALWTDPRRADWARSMAAHGYLALLSGAEREGFERQIEAGIPGPLLEAVAAERWAQALSLLAGRPDALDRLYLLGHLRPRLLTLLGQVPVQRPTFLGLRRVWKAAEARGDGEVFGLLARRFEVEPSTGPGRFRARALAGFSGGTRKFLRRRSWRTLRRLGEAGMAGEYCAMAVGILLPFVDPPAGAPSGRRQRQRPGFESTWTFHQILYRESPRTAEVDGINLRFRLATRPADPKAREEAFPELWDQEPDALALLLDRSRHAEVHRFAARALRSNRPSWHRISIPRLIGWFDAPYPETGELAAEVALTRYDPKEPDLQLVIALLSSPHERPRGTAEGWIKADPAVFLGDVPFVVRLVLNPNPETRRLALEVLGASALLPERARQVIEAVLAAAVRVDPADPEATLRLRDAAATLLTAFARELSDWPLERIAELIRHPAAGVGELGIKILLGHRIRPADLPDDLLAAAMTSVHPVVRGIGIRLYGELPDAVLAERFRALVHLITHPLPDVRAAATPIVVRLTTGGAPTSPHGSGNRAFARVLLGALIPALTAEGDEGMQRDVVRLLRTELAPALPMVEPAQVFRLLRAPATVVQELGGELLRTNVDPGAMTPSQLGILASSDVLGVRRTAWAMLTLRIEEIRRDPETVLPLLESRWEDSRERAFSFVEEQIGLEHLTPEVALAVCDSVRPEVQAFGRRLVVRRFEHTDGLRYLLRLAQHPSAEMQAFAASWLEQHAHGSAERIERLGPFFLGVLTRPNRGRISKLRVLSFLESELEDPGCAAVIARLASELVLTVASSHQQRYVAMLARIRALHPEIPSPLQRIEPEVRGAV